MILLIKQPILKLFAASSEWKVGISIMLLSWIQYVCKAWEALENEKTRDDLGFSVLHLLDQNIWRRQSESDRRIKVLQTCALPLGYGAL